ncbi:MAG: hypothetical protein NTW19_00520 [Planctomycetota bacterium]|nr:hypothetical protein [Planctomycetota bacterium]
MKIQIGSLCVAASILALPLGLAGCGDREVSHTTTSKVSSDGSSKVKEEVVTQKRDGTVTKEEINKKVDNSGATKTEETVTSKSPDGTVTKEETHTTTPPVTP